MIGITGQRAYALVAQRNRKIHASVVCSFRYPLALPLIRELARYLRNQ